MNGAADIVSSTTDEMRARAALTRLAEPGDSELGRCLERLGAVEVVAHIVTGRLQATRLAHYRARLATLDVDGDLAAARRLGARLVVPGDGEWPSRLDDLGEARPVALWVVGDGDLGRLAHRSVSIVGARACTAYGEHVAAEMAAELCDRGWTVVSGAAYGIDGAAHRGALAAGGATVAVLACGLDVVYPSGHDSLLEQIRTCGLVVSELPPGSRPTKPRFLDRNRVIAALTRGTVVVEATLRSGATNSAGHAAKLSRPVMAVPGPVTSATSAGCHNLVRTMDASLVTDAADVLDLVGDLGEDASPERRGDQRPHDGLDELTLRVLEALPVRRAAEAGSVARVAGVDLPAVLRALSELSGRGLAETQEGAWRRTRRAGA